jgi:hypothetical protein
MHHRVFYLEHDDSETGFCFRLQVVPAQLSPLNRDQHYLLIEAVYLLMNCFLRISMPFKNMLTVFILINSNFRLKVILQMSKTAWIIQRILNVTCGTVSKAAFSCL